MTVTCPTCKATLTIPDDRLPKGAALTAVCPKCKGKVPIEPPAGAAQAALAPSAASQTVLVPPAASQTVLVSPGTPAAPEASAAATGRLERPAAYQGRTQRRALVCVAVPEERQQVMAALERGGYTTDPVETAAEAAEKLRFTPYTAVILRDGFGTPAGDGNPVLEHIAEMGMAVRRNLLVVFVSPAVRSHNSPAAFAKSVNLVLNLRDLPHLTEALDETRLEAERTYRVLHESLQAMGKA